MPRMKPSDKAILKQKNDFFDRHRQPTKTRVGSATLGNSPTHAPSTSLKTFDSKGKKV